MAALSLGTWGMLIMGVNGLFTTFLIQAGNILKEAGWPFYRMMAIMALGFGLSLTAAAGFCAKVAAPAPRDAAWLFFRGFSGASTFILKVLAVGLGASPGDVAALGSINTVVAAMLARIFLGEPLGWAHGCAVGLSVTGAVLISQPGFLFESSSTEAGAPWLGYIMATLAGFTQACVFIGVRKSESV